MRKLIVGGLFAATLGTALAIVSALPASAQLARPDSIIDVNGNHLLTTVQYRGRGGHRGVYRGRYYRPGVGIGLGLAAGAIVGGALAAPYYARDYYGSGYYGSGYQRYGGRHMNQAYPRPYQWDPDPNVRLELSRDNYRR